MQVDNTRLSCTERNHRLSSGLCLYCCKNGHFIHNCPVKPPRPVVSIIQSEVEMTNLTLIPVTLQFILGSPWLHLHTPELSWDPCDVICWNGQCYDQCLSNLPLPRSIPLPLASTQVKVQNQNSLQKSQRSMWRSKLRLGNRQPLVYHLIGHRTVPSSCCLEPDFPKGKFHQLISISISPVPRLCHQRRGRVNLNILSGTPLPTKLSNDSRPSLAPLSQAVSEPPLLSPQISRLWTSRQQTDPLAPSSSVLVVHGQIFQIIQACSVKAAFLNSPGLQLRKTALKGFPIALKTAKQLFQHVFRNFGLPEEIVSDRGPQFISHVWKAFFKLLGISVNLSSGYHTQINSQTERKIQELVLDQPSIYTVDEILDSRWLGGSLEYLIDWEEYGPEKRSWIAREDVFDPTLLPEFHRSHPDRPAPRSRGCPQRRVRASGAVPGRGATSTFHVTSSTAHPLSPHYIKDSHPQSITVWSTVHYPYVNSIPLFASSVGLSRDLPGLLVDFPHTDSQLQLNTYKDLQVRFIIAQPILALHITTLSIKLLFGLHLTSASGLIPVVTETPLQHNAATNFNFGLIRR
ncbi:hypothetical protein M9458_052341 [Cirrhinus mrigala]|uniref:Integrase catalytic domain-containing protein n=1 Tax=Cirrhinus mrigala TaxID=683832 RepID=A0ABD0MRD6_CIRMR